MTSRDVGGAINGGVQWAVAVPSKFQLGCVEQPRSALAEFPLSGRADAKGEPAVGCVAGAVEVGRYLVERCTISARYGNLRPRYSRTSISGPRELRKLLAYSASVPSEDATACANRLLRSPLAGRLEQNRRLWNKCLARFDCSTVVPDR